MFRAQAVGEARAAATGQADHSLADVEMLPPILGAEKIICVGINYPERATEYKDRAAVQPKYPNLFVRFPGSLVGHDQPIVRPKVSEKFDYEGEIVLVIGREGRHVPQDQALGLIGGLTLGNEGSVRDWLRHGTLNVTQGKNFDCSGSLGPWIVPADDLDPGKPLHLMTRVNGELRQDDTTDRLTWGFAWLINPASHIHHAAARRPDLDRHPDQRRRPPDPAQLAQARRRGRGRGAADRGAAEQGDRRAVRPTALALFAGQGTSACRRPGP